MARNNLFNSLRSLSVGTIIKVEFPSKAKIYIINDDCDFCELQITETGVYLGDPLNLDDMHSYLHLNSVNEIRM